MPKVDVTKIEELEVLAKLTLSVEEREKAANELRALLDYMEKIKELPTQGVEPFSVCISEENVFREDEVLPSEDRKVILANAPAQKDGQFVVPKTV